MEQSNSFGLVKVTEVFLVPSSFLVAALGAADSNPHRTLISVLGLVVSVLWWVCSHDAFAELVQEGVQTKRRFRVLAVLPHVFIVGWLFSAAVHAWLWNRPLGPH